MRNPHVFVNPKVPKPSKRYFKPRKQQELLMRKMLASHPSEPRAGKFSHSCVYFGLVAIR